MLMAQQLASPAHAKHTYIPEVHHSVTQPTAAFVHVVLWLWAKVMLLHNELKALADSKSPQHNDAAAGNSFTSSAAHTHSAEMAFC